MVVTHLLDTNILSEPVRKSPNSNVMARLQATSGAVAMAAITWHELLFGVLRLDLSPRRNALEQYLFETVQPEIPILPYDASAANWFAIERARLAGRELTPSYSDGQIAAVAVANELILVTRNEADFAKFNDLKVENWFS